MANINSYNDEFKKQIVSLYQNGKSVSCLAKEYNVTRAATYKWIKQFTNSGSFKTKDNLSDLEKQLIQANKELKQLRMENDIFKASSTNNRQKVEIITNNKSKYKIRPICRFLKLSKSTYYFNLKKKEDKIKNNMYDEAVISAFKQNKEVYGTRRLKVSLENKEIYLSRKKIKEIMNQHNLISKYTKLSFKNHHNKVNDSQISNLVNRNFNNRLKNEVIVSDLTYVQVNGKWNYICLLIDLFNREIIGHSVVGTKKDASLVYQAFMQSNRCLKDIQIFHSDRGNEFNNKTIDKLLLAFNITRSLSKKGCPYDNAVAEATFKTFKTEFINDKNFTSLIQLKLELFDYINWYNNIRIHSTLNYLTPVKYHEKMSTKK
ncbi:IS3 family transposase [Spiroplasma endosymbiont of Cleonymus obscurus]|uniref:IS3 family transposase n=1 Tax=Spiroplasma endosymbiont of Cleonymus obscurus TaxID=3066324 RepID=UPI0037DD7BCA